MKALFIFKLIVILTGCVASKETAQGKTQLNLAGSRETSKVSVIKNKNRKANGCIILVSGPKTSAIHY